jgi:hypothetical protein
MAKHAARSKKHAIDGGAPASNDVTRLASVEDLHGQSGQSSGVYIVERDGALPAGAVSVPAARNTRNAMTPLFEHVTLIVYGWKSVEPGTLSWVFPSVGAAVAAARAMTNAVRWAIVAGRSDNDASDGSLATLNMNAALDEARAKGAVLIEQAG